MFDPHQDNRPHIIERAETPRGDLQLQRRGEHYEIISNGTFLMATYNGESERLLVSAALEKAASPTRVLIGGLGAGYSLAEALKDDRVQQATVIEIEQKIIEWNRTHLAPFSGHALDNPRTRILHADILAWITQTEEKFDAICLDIDNGPDWTVTEDNVALYSEKGLQTLTRLLSPEGVLSFWSATSSPDFVTRLGKYFARVETREIPQERGEPDYIFLAAPS
ncbi:MAG: spermine/spermidine synthase [Bacillaceae bacterium]|nr:spermine/spermidine synthase [Bacillaceae bacterium]